MNQRRQHVIRNENCTKENSAGICVSLIEQLKFKRSSDEAELLPVGFKGVRECLAEGNSRKVYLEFSNKSCLTSAVTA